MAFCVATMTKLGLLSLHMLTAVARLIEHYRFGVPDVRARGHRLVQKQHQHHEPCACPAPGSKPGLPTQLHLGLRGRLGGVWGRRCRKLAMKTTKYTAPPNLSITAPPPGYLSARVRPILGRRIVEAIRCASAAFCE